LDEKILQITPDGVQLEDVVYQRVPSLGPHESRAARWKSQTFLRDGRSFETQLLGLIHDAVSDFALCVGCSQGGLE